MRICEVWGVPFLDVRCHQILVDSVPNCEMLWVHRAHHWQVSSTHTVRSTHSRVSLEQKVYQNQMIVELIVATTCVAATSTGLFVLAAVAGEKHKDRVLDRGRELFHRRHLDRAIQWYRRFIASRKGQVSLNVALAHEELAQALQCKSILAHGGDSSSFQSLLRNYENFGNAWSDECCDAAENHHRQALLIRRELMCQTSHLLEARSQFKLGMLLRNKGQYSSGIACFQASIEIYKSKAPNSLALAHAYKGLAFLFFGQGRFEEASRCLRKAVDIGEKLCDDILDAASSMHDKPETIYWHAVFLCNTAWFLLRENRGVEQHAGNLLARARQMTKEVPALHGYIDFVTGFLLNQFNEPRYFEVATTRLKHALETLKNHSFSAYMVQECNAQLALAYSHILAPEKAHICIDLLAQSIDYFESRGDKKSVPYALTQQVFGKVKLRLFKPLDARDYLQDSHDIIAEEAPNNYFLVNAISSDQSVVQDAVVAYEKAISRQQVPPSPKSTIHMWDLEACEVFLSHTGHSEQSTHVAGHVESQLQQYHGARVFLDSKYMDRACFDWQREIKKNVRACKVFVVFISVEFYERFWCLEELDLAIYWGKPILPVCFDCSPRKVDESVRRQIGETLTRHSEAPVDPVKAERWAQNLEKLRTIQAVRNYDLSKHNQSTFVTRIIDEIKGELAEKSDSCDALIRAKLHELQIPLG